MSNWINCNLEILASTPHEMNAIVGRLNQPSPELASWIAQQFGQPVNEVVEGLTQLLEFTVVKNLGYIDNTINKARLLSIAFNVKHYGIVRSHLFEVSEAFPAAIFLFEHCDLQASYTGKQVIRSGEVVQEVLDGDQQVQGLEWALLDIFAPFRAEYYGDGKAEFRSLWQPWVDAMIAAARQLKGGGDGAESRRLESLE